MRSGYNMEKAVEAPTGRARHIVAKICRDARIVAIVSTIVGAGVYGAGWVWLAFLSGASITVYPQGCAIVAGVFVGIGIDTGIVVGLIGLVTEATEKIRHPSVRAADNRKTL